MRNRSYRPREVYVAIENGSEKIAGYYTLAAASVPLTNLPQPVIKRLPRYPSVPVARLGRLAVDQSFHGQKLGAALLANAVMRAIGARAFQAVFRQKNVIRVVDPSAPAIDASIADHNDGDDSDAVTDTVMSEPVKKPRKKQEAKKGIAP